MDSEDPLALHEQQFQGAPVTDQSSSDGWSSPLQSTVLQPTAGENGRDQAASCSESMEVEMLDQDEFDFLDGATQLGSLRIGT